MAFESLSDKLQSAFEKLKGKGVITESDVNDVMREVKLALLEADVNFRIVKEFDHSDGSRSLEAGQPDGAFFVCLCGRCGTGSVSGIFGS